MKLQFELVYIIFVCFKWTKMDTVIEDEETIDIKPYIKPDIETIDMSAGYSGNEVAGEQ